MGIWDDDRKRITQDERERIEALEDSTERMRQNEREFILQMIDNINQWGDRAFFSDAQRGFLGSIEERYLR